MKRAVLQRRPVCPPTAFALPSGNSWLSTAYLDQHRLEIASSRFAHTIVPSDAQRKTIYALSTPPGKAGVAVVRVSGPDALDVRTRLVQLKRRQTQPESRRMDLCRVVHPETGETLDDGLAVFFKGPKSFTTEDSALSSLPYCRPAEPGEFTRRAFHGGRLDLTQVEGLKDLIDAETEGQRRMALRAAGGRVREQFERLRTDIISCLAKVEALIDFGEGEDIEEGVYDEARKRAREIKDTIQSFLQDSRRGEIMRTGVRLTIFGPPNAGKSSLLNFLAQREAAIVTAVPGTTRDILELSLDIGGIPVIVADTAGLRQTEDLVEQIGVERAGVRAADVALCVVSCEDMKDLSVELPPTVRPFVTDETFVLFNKSDLDTGDVRATPSLKTGKDTSEFLEGFAKALQKRYLSRYLELSDDTSADTPLITHTRHRVHLESAAQFIDAFLATSQKDMVIGAEELRYAARAVGKVSGLIDVEDVLDALFRDFCIGK
ncbi:tRNA modification GTPase TrmE [Roridomyces roridus]|uniref:tRNA modification GTPase TrmE n=1 Tax=Roridomyces roridus TaxID=1738132 RepID=A0AAD7FR93_9AGAR|nr:tRNA modification GTPase TrmE [Roridomyces roridus]